MWGLVRSQLMHRLGRSAALVAGVLVAAVSFALLTSAVATGQLRVKGTVTKNFRAAYDILVRPPGSTTPLERSRGLVQQNYLTGIFGGISLDQYEQIKKVPGVDVAAPIANIGYVLQSTDIPVDVTDLLDSSPRQVFRISSTWTADRGLSTYRDRDNYVYVSRSPFDFSKGIEEYDPVTRKAQSVCDSYNASAGRPSPFDPQNRTSLICWSTVTPDNQLRSFLRLPPGHIGDHVLWSFPFLLSAVDPVQEARLVGLQSAVTGGRYLTEAEGVRTVQAGSNLRVRVVPVLAASRPFIDDRLTIAVERLSDVNPNEAPSVLASDRSRSYLQSLPGKLVRSKQVNLKPTYDSLLQGYTTRPLEFSVANYWTAAPVRYAELAPARLRPAAVTNPPNTWLGIGGFSFPPMDSADVQFRSLTEHDHINTFTSATRPDPALQVVGRFDADKLPGFSPLSQVPLTTYNPPQAAPADARTAKLLGNRDLLPNADIGNYLSQPPLLLTTLKALPAFTNPTAYENPNTAKPISVIRVRVAGVTGPDALSRERIRATAEAIAQRTGLLVDITIGSSPTPVTIELPAGKFGRPALTLREGWVAKGVAVAFLRAVDRKSLALFSLVLLVCVLFLVNAALAATRARRTELGVLACLGWPPRRIFALLLAELATLGLLAGLAGTAVAAGLAAALHLHLSGLSLVLIAPVATVVAGLAGLVPAARAARAAPLAAIRPAVAAPRGRSRVNTVGGLAVANLARVPGRTLLGAASLFVGVVALSLLIAISAGFRGQLVGTLLGSAVSVQVRGVDYLAAVLTLVLGAFAVADVTYLNLTERTEEVGTFRAAGWTDGHVRRLLALEGLATAAAAALAGAAVGVLAVTALVRVPLGPTIAAAGVAAAAGVLTAAVALLVPLARLARVAPAAAIAEE
jgi:putative ABC transport system permease protein